jgi:hypothetical protein
MERTKARQERIRMVKETYERPDTGEGMSKGEYRLLYNALCALYSRNALTDANRRAVWYALLKDVPYAVLFKHLLAHASWCPYAPTVAELRGNVCESESKSEPARTVKKNSFNNFHQREYDWEELERQLLNV